MVDRSVIKNWLVRNKKGNYTLDKKLVADYVYNLGYKYDTFGCTRTFLTYDGREKVIEGGDYGWAIDQAAETEALIKAIKDGTIDEREPVYVYKGWSRNTNDIGYTYIEIDLTNQRMVFYKDGAPIVDTPVVTGNPNVDGNETPTGCFAVDAMMSPYVLKGEGPFHTNRMLCTGCHAFTGGPQRTWICVAGYILDAVFRKCGSSRCILENGIRRESVSAGWFSWLCKHALQPGGNYLPEY